jgi:hypothetical protein
MPTGGSAACCGGTWTISEEAAMRRHSGNPIQITRRMLALAVIASASILRVI